ncbi:L-threonylcarbamoyladenylate synthase [Pigmentibacter sp. JX0631]|uniref:L-threonylcarbamoyladenylate synthase n=1 Tax=Pigmentibacter sp. JX0631 TaxID=2976982 RepID=UPI0024694413|nr:L-threonylcarbamoyladenylate synthase [Pigmentibacter sp. JX0631]WGL61386.1 L-threonylcarbamoyladenylate synthase [Pigmentibacter sp. JX0631]
MAKIVTALKPESLAECSQLLQAGELVAFPTETVYGLGANALNEKALEKIFLAKGRPKSDPLIVHLSGMVQAESLSEMTAFQRQCFDILGNEFWPGPLTMIVKASGSVPKIVTAGGDSIALRIPNGETALKLLKLVKLPIAAPSANKFGHVSPTTAQHVMDDLGNEEKLIILEQDKDCNIGIESTIIKIMEDDEIHLLRPGFISTIQIASILKKNKITFNLKKVKKTVVSNSSENEKLDSPGQLLTHYSPNIESFILVDENNKNKVTTELFLKKYLKKTILIDFNGKNLKYSEQVLQYYDLSMNGNNLEASKNLFSYLRKSEIIHNAEYILLPDFSEASDEELIAIYDRIFRAASGKYVTFS